MKDWGKLSKVKKRGLIIKTNKEYICDRCHARPALAKIKYCKECKKIIIKELDACGYLQRIGDRHIGQRRTGEQRELTYQTKHGTGH